MGGMAYYDPNLNITWLADANYAFTSGYDDDGRMSWDAANAWIGTLNAATYLGTDQWRLPTMVDTGTPGCNYSYNWTDCGYNVQTISGTTVYSEMAALFHVTLGNLSYTDAFGNPAQSGWGLKNTGPFLNIQGGYAFYWSGLEYALNSDAAWDYSFGYGYQDGNYKYVESHVWPVASGDILNTILRCDLNDNGKVDTGDLVQVLRMVNGSIADDLDCDISNGGTGDGIISAADLIKVTRIVLGIDPEISN